MRTGKWGKLIHLGLLVAVFLLVWPGCGGERTEKSEVLYKQEIAEMVSQVTSGIISSDDEIQVRFVDAIASEDIVGVALTDEVFSFTPQIDGIARWIDRHTLVFKPNSKLPFRRSFTGSLDLKTLIPGWTGDPLMEFTFDVAGREVAKLKGDFILPDKEDPNVLIYSGTISFTEPTELEFVRQSVKLFRERREMTLQWDEIKGGLEFRFNSKPFARAKEPVTFGLTVDNRPTDLPQPIVKSFVLHPLKAFKLVDIRTVDQGKHPGLELIFSDPLDDSQDITGLVQVTPVIPLVMRTMGKTIHVSADFDFGMSYKLTVSAIRSKWGAKLQKSVEKQVSFEDKKPRISFLNNGSFLTSGSEQKIGFKTINVQNVRLKIYKVFESNLGQFLQTEQLLAAKQRSDDFNSYNVNRVGVIVVNKVLTIGKVKNRWLNHQLDLKKLIDPGEKGLLLVSLSFQKKDMLYSGLTKERQYYYGRDYYSNPNSSGYLWRHGRVFKPLIISDIGLTYKRGGNGHVVLATNLLDSSPMKDVEVTLRTFQNQIVATKSTGSDGQVVFQNIKERVFYVEAEKDGQRSVIKPSEMAWNISSFEVGGHEVTADETQAFIFTERGVYRPGDQVNVSIIARNRDGSFPKNHPISLKIYNPRNQVVFDRTSTEGIDGFYSFLFQSKPDDPTGNWKAKFQVGSRTFYHTLKIETVAPYRLKVNLTPQKDLLEPEDKRLDLKLVSTYLFGAPAAELGAEVEVTLAHSDFKPKKYPGYIFKNESMRFKSIKRKIFEEKLNREGTANVGWSLPPLTGVPSMLSARVTAKVFEKGGRASRNDVFIPVNPYDHYVGLQKPRFTWGYGQVGQSLGINTIVTDSTGRPASGRQLTYRIYHNSRYWWWEYDTRDDFRIRYKKDTFTKLVKEGSLMSRNVPSRIEFTPEGSGEFLIEVREGQKDGHAAGFFFSAYYWGDSPVTDVGAGTLVLKSDKKIYHPGDTATITFPTPENGTIFVSVEKGHRILESKAVRAKTENKEYQTVIPITAEMLPNAYVSVSIIQPHGQTLNDRPLRMYGVIPLHVEDPRTRQRLEISMPNELRSEEEFEVTVTSVDKRSTQFTIAVVDEGLLDITRFKTPNPWSHFFKKQRLGVLTFDLFGLVIGAHKGDIFRLFSVGGEVEGAGYRDSQLEPAGKKRFPAVSMFQGPLETDESGRSRVKFKLPNYIGSVRVMVVSASGRSYGSVDKTVPVKTELMVLPTLPRALGPTDIFSLPVTVFAMKEKIKNVEVKVEASGPVEIMGAERKSIKFDSPGERDAIFELKALPAVGEAKVTVTASSGRFRSSKISEIVVRPYSPRLFSVEKKECLPGDSVKLKIPDRGIPGTNQAVISVMRRDQLNLGHRLKWLIHYPYGCIEQTVSAVFPQLYLKEFIKRSADHESEIDRNINAAIEKLRRFSTASGGFGFWPGGSQVSIWGTNYAGHFLCEAKKLGYRIPDGLLSSWIRFQKSRSLTTRDSLLVKVYRLYTLALAGEAQIGPMNLIKETSLKEMTNTEKWMLAASYFLAGHPDVAKNIFRGARTDVSEYKEVGGTYGSWLRDKAMILEATTLFEEWNLADKIFEEVVLEISGKSWYSTQSLGYALLALGKYIQANQSDFRDVKPLMSGYIKIPGKKRIPFKTERLKVSQEITAGFGENVQVVIDKETNLKRVFVALEWNGVPLRPDVKDSSSNLILEVEWLNENGMQIEPSSIKQGTTFWGHFRARSNTYRRRGLEELALVQLMPSGWEIENIRLQGEELPEWMRKWALNREEYQDIRDDRVMWFFDLPWNQKHLDFVVKLTAVTVGEFILPPTLFEAMYDNNYKAIKSGMSVKVTER